MYIDPLVWIGISGFTLLMIALSSFCLDKTSTLLFATLLDSAAAEVELELEFEYEQT
jgi:hypothetical protein